MSIMEYINSWSFYFYILWISSAIGFGLCMGMYLFYLFDSILDNLSKLKFKKEK